MKKFLSLCLMALVCCVTGALAQANPEFVPVTVDPADGSTVATLSEIRVTMPKTLGNLDKSAGTVKVYAEGDETTPVTTGTCAMDPWASADVVITLAQAVTEAGNYVVVIPEETIYEDWYGDNWAPELRLNYTVEGGAAPVAGVTVENVTPEPCNEEGTYVTEIPHTVTFTMSSADFTVDAYGVTLQYDNLPFPASLEGQYTVEGNTITVNIPEKYWTKDIVMVCIKAKSADGTPITYMNDQQIVATYEVQPQAEVYEISPEPYWEGGDYSTEIPQTVTVTMSNENFTLAETGAVTVLAGEEVLDDYMFSYKKEGNTIVVTIEPMGSGVTAVTVKIKATSANGEAITYNDTEGEGLIVLPYEVSRSSFVPTSTNPEEGVVASLKEITLSFPDMVSNFDNSKEVLLNNESGETVTTGTVGYGIGMADGLVTLAEEVTAPGTYTLVIPEAAFSSYSGLYSPELIYTFTIEASAEPVTVESISPEPYVDGGEYTEEMPAEVVITMSGEDFTVAEGGVTCYYGAMGLATPIDEYTVEGNTITIPVPESIQGETSLLFRITATDAEGNAITYGSDECIEFAYEMPNNSYVPSTVEPADNSTVESLKEFVLEFTPWVSQADNTKTATLEDADGNVVATGTFGWTGEFGQNVLITLDNEVTTAGTYTLVIPEKSFSPDFNYDVYNPELRYTYTVTGTVGINGVKVNADGTVKVYTIDGVFVGEGQAADVLGKLAKGIYIVNGTKVAVK